MQSNQINLPHTKRRKKDLEQERENLVGVWTKS